MDTTRLEALPRRSPRPARRRRLRSAAQVMAPRTLRAAEARTENRRSLVPAPQPLAHAPEAADQPDWDDRRDRDLEWSAFVRTSDARLATLLIELAAGEPESTLAALIARAVARCVDDAAMVAALARTIARVSADLAAALDTDEALAAKPSGRAVNAAPVRS
ncbi:MAG TPA: hypothetical protein VFI22_10800 [Thermomicrobiales bacterium]|nr:hypothetical protein [Thermomicrobiales bacterium]